MTRRARAISALMATLCIAPLCEVRAEQAPRALVNPFAGFGVLIGPYDARVLGAGEAPSIEAMLQGQPGAALRLGDVQVLAREVHVEVLRRQARATVVLLHRDDPAAPRDAVKTARFAIVPDSALAKDKPTLAALEARIREGEDRVAWTRAAAATEPESGSPAGLLRDSLRSAELGLTTGDADAARDAIRKALGAKVAWGPEALFDLAVAARLVGLRSEAESTWTALLATLRPAGKTEARDPALLAAVQAALGDEEGARATLAACAARLTPDRAVSVCAAFDTVRALAVRARWTEAGRLLDADLARIPRPTMALLALRTGLASAADDGEAELAIARRAGDLYPDRSETADMLVGAYFRLGRFEEAVRTADVLYRKAGGKLTLLGRMSGMLNRWRGAADADPSKGAGLDRVEAEFAARAAQDSNDIAAQFLDAVRHYYDGEFEPARLALGRLHGLNLPEARVPLYLAMAHFWLGHQTEAERLIEEAVATGPADPDVYFCRSQIWLDKDLPRATAELERYVRITSGPWSISNPHKEAMVRRDLALMRAGTVPERWDKPGRGKREPPAPSPQDARVQAWLAPIPDDDDPLRPHAVEHQGERVTLRFRGGAEHCALRVFPIVEVGPGDMSARSVGMRREGPEQGPCGNQVSQAINRIRAHDVAPVAHAPMPAQRSLLDRVLIALGGLLLACVAWGVICVGRLLDQRSWWLLLVLAAIAFALRAAAPHRLVMVYFGYEHVGEAVSLDHLPRYGPGAPVLWWLLFRVVAPDHAAVQWLHVALGSATVGLLSVWVHRATSNLRAGVFSGLLLAMTPLFVRDHASESMGVPAVFALSLAALLVTTAVGRLDPARPHEPPHAGPGPIGALAAAAGCLLYAASCRPDLALGALPFALGCALAVHPPAALGAALRRAWPVLVTAVVLGLPLVLFAADRANVDLGRGNLPHLSGDLVAELPQRIRSLNALVLPEAFPVAIWLVIVFAATLSPAGKRALWLVAAGAVALGPTFADLNEVSILRLHVPAATCVLMASGLGFAALDAFGARGRIASTVLLLVTVASMAPSVPPLFAPRNPDLEESLIREAREALDRVPERPLWLARPGYEDTETSDVHLHFPNYLFSAANIQVTGLRPLAEALRLGAPDRPVFFLRSLRCHLHAAWSPDRGEIDACRSLCERARCEPVFEHDAPNLGDWPTFHGYGDAPALPVGLYRVLPR